MKRYIKTDLLEKIRSNEKEADRLNKENRRLELMESKRSHDKLVGVVLFRKKFPEFYCIVRSVDGSCVKIDSYENVDGEIRFHNSHTWLITQLLIFFDAPSEEKQNDIRKKIERVNKNFSIKDIIGAFRKLDHQISFTRPGSNTKITVVTNLSSLSEDDLDSTDWRIKYA